MKANLSDNDLSRLQAQITKEYAEGLNYVRPKRIQYRERVQKRNKQKKDPTKLNINMIANHIDTLVASSYTDWLTVQFAPRDGWIGQEKADNLNFMAEFDNNEEDYQQMYYQKEQDRYFFGVAIRYRCWWDDVRKLPLFAVINPLCWIPDPVPSQTGSFDWKNYRFMGFEYTTTIQDMVAENKYSKEQLDNLVKNYFSTENRLNRNAYAQAYNYNYPTTVEWLKHNFSVDIYYHFTSYAPEGSYDAKKYKITMMAEAQTIIDVEELIPVLKEEKEKPSLVSFPIVLNYWKPRRNDPFGESVCDKLDDYQTAKSILFNLNLIKAKKEALGGDFIWNSRLIKNKQDILKPTTYGRNIFVDTTESLNNVWVEIPRSQIKGDSFNMITAIDNEARLNTNIDMQQMGLANSSWMTATEAQINQANNNVIGLLNNKINAVWDKHFRFERWRTYQQFFSPKDTKNLTVNANFEFKSLAITKDDFPTSQMPFVVVGTTGEIDGVKQQERMFWDKSLSLLLQDPNTPDVSKLIAKRMWMRCNRKTPNEVNVLVPLTTFEKKAYEYLGMVNLNVVPKSLLNNPPEAYATFRVYLQKAENTNAKDVVLATLQEAMATQPQGWMQAAPTPQNFNETANSTNNIAMSQAIQSSGKQSPSRMDNLPQ